MIYMQIWVLIAGSDMSQSMQNETVSHWNALTTLFLHCGIQRFLEQDGFMMFYAHERPKACDSEIAFCSKLYLQPSELIHAERR